MLASKESVYLSTVHLFLKEHRLAAHRTVGNISKMIRSFLLANLAVGVVSGIISAIVFWRLGIQYFYFIGAISGLVTLIPYLGMFLALLPPLAGGAGTLHHAGIITVIVTVIGIHATTMNLIYPELSAHVSNSMRSQSAYPFCSGHGSGERPASFLPSRSSEP